MGAYTIRELENLSGIKAHTIRIWEKRYGLIAPHRTSTNIRTYCDSELRKLLNISILNRNGLKISKIARLSQDEIAQQVNHFNEDVTSTENQVESLTLAMIDMDEYRFEQVLARSIIKFGFEEAVMHVVYPFFVKVGLMWQTGSISPVQEHFVSGIIRQKFFVAIDSLAGNDKPGVPRFVFFLPEGEYHEFGLLFFCYMAKKRGFQTIYLGQSLPIDDLPDLARSKKIDYLVTSSSTSINGKNVLSFIKQLSSLFPEQVVFVSGSGTQQVTGNIPAKVILIHAPSEFIARLETIAAT
ncbi:MAG: MerR family transcriptional regulator [Bacteroidales bacterium]